MEQSAGGEKLDEARRSMMKRDGPTRDYRLEQGPDEFFVQDLVKYKL